MIKVKQIMIAKHFGVSPRAVRYRVEKAKGFDTMEQLMEVLDFYNRKKK